MNENQLRKFKGQLLNIQIQIESAALKLNHDPIEMQTMHKLKLASHELREAIAFAEDIKAVEDSKPQPKKKKKKAGGKTEPAVIVITKDPTVGVNYNIRCRNYSEVRNSEGKVIERGCTVGMDMDFCSKKCAYATNNVCPLKSY